MTPEQIRLVQTSFDRVFTAREALSTTFYEELFRIAPESRALFSEDLTEQRMKLSDTLAYVVVNLHRFEVLEETIIGLARRHVDYGAEPDHFAIVGMALIHALRVHLPDGLSEDEAASWLAAYSLISDLMIEEMVKAA